MHVNKAQNSREKTFPWHLADQSAARPGSPGGQNRFQTVYRSVSCCIRSLTRVWREGAVFISAATFWQAWFTVE